MPIINNDNENDNNMDNSDQCYDRHSVSMNMNSVPMTDLTNICNNDNNSINDNNWDAMSLNSTTFHTHFHNIVMMI